MSIQVRYTDRDPRIVHENAVSTNMKHNIERLCCIGAGYVGGPTSAVIALKNPQISVTVVDKNEDIIKAWNSQYPPIYEPGLPAIIEATRISPASPGQEIDTSFGSYHKAKHDRTENGAGSPTHDQKNAIRNLQFSTDIDQAIIDAEIILISVDTPTKTEGKGRNFAADISAVEQVARHIAKVSNGYKIVVEKSTVPCKTAESIRDILLANSNSGATFDIISNPEFLSEGTAIENLLNPDRVLIGSMKTARGRQAAKALSSIYERWIPVGRIITTNIWSSELAKLAANAMLAQRISSINALSAICEETGADIEEVVNACGTDSRIGPRMLKASVGFGGSCFRKDVLSLVYLAESLSLHDVAEYWKAVVSLNEQQKQRFSTRVVACLFNTMKGKKIAVLGFAYKKDTGDARESPAITLVRDFVAEGAKVSMFDPKVPLATVQNELLAAGVSPMKLKSSITFEPNPYDACAQADAVVLVTEWDMFSNKLETVQPHSQETRPVGNVHHSTQEAGVESAPFHEDGDTTNADADNKQRLATNGSSNGAIHIAGTHGSSVNSIPRLDWSFIAANMRKPKFVFDGRNILDVDKLKDLGFVVESIGKSSLRHR